ncbi:hypothetical protein TWF481_002068 [Arthrobotrys musiformis]|uniref:Uncharacterized protein n=1 Tax=Arthrobotrys musiformis TaxID=47236 RepID=A0AAV9VSA1_9PEZI
MFKGLLGGGNAPKNQKKDRGSARKDSPRRDRDKNRDRDRDRDRHKAPQSPTENLNLHHERGRDKRSPNPHHRRDHHDDDPPRKVPKIDILKFPPFPFSWPTPEMTHQQWYISLSLKKDDVEFIVDKWWHKVQSFFKTYDPYTIQLEEDLKEAVRNVRRLRRERDAWKKEHDDVFVMYQKLKMAKDRQGGAGPSREAANRFIAKDSDRDYTG